MGGVDFLKRINEYIVSDKLSSSFVSPPPTTASERRENNLKGLRDICLKMGSGQGQNLALTVSCVPYALDSGLLATKVFWNSRLGDFPSGQQQGMTYLDATRNNSYNQNFERATRLKSNQTLKYERCQQVTVLNAGSIGVLDWYAPGPSDPLTIFISYLTKSFYNVVLQKSIPA